MERTISPLLRVLAVIIAAVSLLWGTVGCQKGPYEVTSISDFAVFDEHLYVLIEREIGVNTASVLSHSNGMKAKHRLLAIVRCDLTSSNLRTVTLVAKRDITTGQLLRSHGFQLCSTNSVVVRTGRDSFLMSALDDKQSSYSGMVLAAEDVYFTEGRELLFGCGSENWVLDTDTATMLSDPEVLRLGKTLCDASSKQDWGFAAVSTNAWTVVTHDMHAEPREICVMRRDEPGIVRRIQIPPGWVRLASVHGHDAETKVLLSGITDGLQDYALIKDLDGKELARANLIDEPRADISCRTIVSIPKHLSGGKETWAKIEVNVWHPWEDRRVDFNIDLTEIVANLKPTD